MAANAIQLARGVASLLNTEFKYSDIVAAPTLGSTFTCVCLNSLSQGSTQSTRSGASVKVKRLTFNSTLTAGATSVNLCRIIIFIAKQPMGYLPVSMLSSVNSVISPLAPERATQFHILMDTNVLVDSVNAPVKQFTYDVNLSQHTEYNGNAGTYADISTGGIYIAYFDALMSGITHSLFNYYSRIEYLDN